MKKLTDILIVWGGTGVAMAIFWSEGVTIGHLLASTLYIMAIVWYMDDDYCVN